MVQKRNLIKISKIVPLNGFWNLVHYHQSSLLK